MTIVAHERALSTPLRLVASDVVPDIERGPAWMPDNRRIAYVRDALEGVGRCLEDGIDV